MSEEMFIESVESVKEESAPPVIVKKERKKRAPMSEERKAVLREQLKKAREIKAKKKLEANGEDAPKSKVIKKERNIVPKVPKVPEPLSPIVEDEAGELRRQIMDLIAANKAQENEILKGQLAAQKLKKKELKKTISEPPPPIVMEEPKGPGFPELPSKKDDEPQPPSPIAPSKRKIAPSIWDQYLD